MARASKLKVYRTPIGFHDAYVAAPSQKAALEAWSTNVNLFARGEAEVVEDAELSAEPLAHPGTVIRKLRGDTREQISALGSPQTKKQTQERKARGSKIARPSRAKLDKAEEALRRADSAHIERVREIEAKQRVLAEERRKAEEAYDRERQKLAANEAAQRSTYQAALDTWLESQT